MPSINSYTSNSHQPSKVVSIRNHGSGSSTQSSASIDLSHYWHRCQYCDCALDRHRCTSNASTASLAHFAHKFAQSATSTTREDNEISHAGKAANSHIQQRNIQAKAQVKEDTFF